MQGKFNIKIVSDLDYEEMVADVCYEGYVLGTITQDEGIEKMKIEIPLSDQGEAKLSVPLDEYIDILKKAKELLTARNLR